ncbi:RHS repeat protein [Flavobacterium cucumis]|uniref:YD repeat-containing protein n=1 Tax=Flavobacterium cucumis TaxID=416016 RepID=A0A1M7ZWU1_9FLAO|nr:RHS repeat protein [Flavobacterium cucumis]SHO73273.1 hypothetical protein SAMN05443547_1629 [Flavobacterium cucumis]
MRKKIILPIICFVVSSVFAQEMPKIIPPSPEASSFSKFTEVPISLYTGVPNISIPIFQISVKDLSIPITVDYHSRGINVGEIASRVGLGWNLNYGGSISRQTRGLSDEDAYGFLNNNTSKEEFFNNPTLRHNIRQTYINNPSYDFTPDQFFFNANGLSGKFVFDQNDGKPVIQKFGDIDINYAIENGQIKSFVLKDGKGNTYYYGKSKDGTRFAADKDNVSRSIVIGEVNTRPAINNENNTSYYNTWHLMDIETNLGKQISFHYGSQEQIIYYSKSADVLEYNTSSSPEGGFPTMTSEYKSYMSEIRSDQYRLEEIVYEGGKVDCIYSTTTRQDLRNSNFLEKIIISDFKNKITKEYKFSYNYTTSPDDNNQLSFLKNSEPEAAKRLFLKSIQQINVSDNKVLPSHQFEYSNQILPNRHSTSQDIWGYYNGKNNGGFLKFYNSELGGRTVDTVKAEAGLLKKIILPEGGTTSFHYEHNKVLNTFPRKLIFLSPNPIVNKTAWLTHLSYSSNFQNGSYVKQFSVGNNKIGSSSYRVRFDDTVGCGYPNNTYECKFLVSVRHIENNQTFQMFLGERTITLRPGTYELKVTPLDPYHDPIQMGHGFGVDIFWNEELESPNEMVFAGGKRIKKIEYRDSDDQISLVKSYGYSNPNTGITSGQLLGLPNFLSLNTRYSEEGFNVTEPYGCLPGKPLSTYQGNSVGYAFVTEYYGDKNANIGKTVHEFSMTPDSGLYYEFPYHMPTDNEWLRGKELETTYFLKSATGYSPVKKVTNKYLFGDQIIEGGYSIPNIFTPIPIRLLINEDLTVNSLTYSKNKRMVRLPIITYANYSLEYGPGVVVHYKTYHLTGGTLDLLSSTTVDYMTNSDEIIAAINYKYNYDHHYNIASVEQKDSNNQMQKTEYNYASDLNNQVLKDKRILEIPLITKTFKENQLLSTTETQYKNWGNNLLAPEIIKTAKGNLPVEDRIKYTILDNTNGNPIEIEQVGGVKIIYIWGYNKTQPIAKIENATYASVQGYVSNLQTLSNGADEQGLISALNNLRTVLPNAMVTTYTYKPLVGISTVTDPKGDKQTYHYDSFNRLQFVKDAQGNILSENQYHYRTQN